MRGDKKYDRNAHPTHEVHKLPPGKRAEDFIFNLNKLWYLKAHYCSVYQTSDGHKLRLCPSDVSSPSSPLLPSRHSSAVTPAFSALVHPPGLSYTPARCHCSLRADTAPGTPHTHAPGLHPLPWCGAGG